MKRYRPKFKDRKTGEVRETKRWYIDFSDHHGTRQRFRGDEDEHTTAEFGRMLEDLVRCRKRDITPKDNKLWNWLMAQPTKIQEKLIKLDLAEKQWFPALCKPEKLKDHIKAFENWLTTSKARSGFHRNKKHIENTLTRIRAIVDGCGFIAWGDISKSSVETYLGGMSISPGTYNLYVQAIKQFCQWCVKENKADFSPLQFLDRLTMPIKEKRQALSYEAVCRLLKATVKAPKRYGMSGTERAILYRVAIETGFRRNELRNLTVGDFDAKTATISQQAKFCKDRRDTAQPITMTLASRLRDYLDGRDNQSRLFNLWSQKSAEMIKDDAASAGLPITDSHGRKLVFHSLRHTLRTELVKAQVIEAVIDNIMRHKTNDIGRRFYTHITDFQARQAIERLPEYPWPGDLAQSQIKAVS